MKMLEELTKQVRRLFSSKNNGGKLVYKLTDRLHYYKQTLLGLSLALLLGYAQFRVHFKCQGTGQLDDKTTTTFCLMNGTFTLNVIDKTNSGSLVSTAGTHVGMHYMPTRPGEMELVSHNYMRSLWGLLIAMAVCSYFAQRSWSSIFNNETLKALLKLPGYEGLPVVKRAQKSNVYQKLSKLQPSISRKQSADSGKSDRWQAAQKFSTPEEQKNLFHTIDILSGDTNECNRALDHYLTQLIYLLIASRASAYRLAGLRLRRHLINHSIRSFVLTLMQFVVPWLIIGQKYTLYGFEYAKEWLRYTLKELITGQPINSVDYMLSSQIWPISTMCRYSQSGYQDTDMVTVQCTSPINEICAKLFAVIWWFVMINIVIELYALLWILTSSINFKTTRWILGRKSWPKARKEAQQVAGFRYKRALVRNNLEEDEAVSPPLNGMAGHREEELSEREKKYLEAESDRARASLSHKKWYLWCSRDICMFLANQSKKIGEVSGIKGNNSLRDEEGFREEEEDQNIYYFLHLLYLRLNCSRKKTQQVIRLTSGALKNYLDYLEKSTDEFRPADEEPSIVVETQPSSTGDKLEMNPISRFGTPTGNLDGNETLPLGNRPSGGTTLDV